MIEIEVRYKICSDLASSSAPRPTLALTCSSWLVDRNCKRDSVSLWFWIHSHLLCSFAPLSRFFRLVVRCSVRLVWWREGWSVGWRCFAVCTWHRLKLYRVTAPRTHAMKQLPARILLWPHHYPLEIAYHPHKYTRLHGPYAPILYLPPSHHLYYQPPIYRV